MDLELSGKTALISGASRGIGLAVARGFLLEGAQVALSGRSQDTLNNAKRELLTNGCEGREDDVLLLNSDLSVLNDIREAVAATAEYFGALDCVVANIGETSYPTGWQIEHEHWDRSFNNNLIAGANLATESIPYLIKSHGCFTFVSSIAGVESLPAPIPYSAAKAAIHSVAKGLAFDLGADQVRINVVAPGNVYYPGGNWDKKLQITDQKKMIESYIRSEVPMQRFGTPEEIADAVVYLSSQRASFISGTCLVVDGGQTRSHF